MTERRVVWHSTVQIGMVGGGLGGWEQQDYGVFFVFMRSWCSFCSHEVLSM